MTQDLHLADHPLVHDRMARLRDKSCATPEFRKYVREIGRILGLEAARRLPLQKTRIETPIQAMDAQTLKGPPPVIVPILRAGLALADGVLDVLPEASLGHIGVYRDEHTKKPVEYLVRMPPLNEAHYFLVDPMLATGGSAIHAVDILKRRGVPLARVTLIVMVCAPEGIKTLHESHPDLPIVAAALDERLNEAAFIVPGLGDAGDRIFGT